HSDSSKRLHGSHGSHSPKNANRRRHRTHHLSPSRDRDIVASPFPHIAFPYETGASATVATSDRPVPATGIEKFLPKGIVDIANVIRNGEPFRVQRSSIG